MSGFCCAAHGSAATSNIAAARAEIISLISSHSSLIQNWVPDSPLPGATASLKRAPWLSATEDAHQHINAETRRTFPQSPVEI
jgi:hypothetical protein